MRPLLVAVASNKTYLDDLDSQLRALVGDHFTIVSMTCARYRSLQKHEEKILFLSAPHVIDMVREAIPDDCTVISPKRVINPQSLHRLLEIPRNSDVLVVNNTYANALEIVDEMLLLGFGHLNLVAHQPFTVPKKAYHYAITADELELVPPEIPVVINIGTRLLSLKSLDKLKNHSQELDNMFDNWIYERYAKFILQQADHMRQTGRGSGADGQKEVQEAELEPVRETRQENVLANDCPDDRATLRVNAPVKDQVKDQVKASENDRSRAWLDEQLKEQMQVVLSAFDDGVAIVGEDGVISCTNSRAVHLLGNAPLEGRCLREFGIGIADLRKQSAFKVVASRTLFIEARELKADTDPPGFLVFIRDISRADGESRTAAESRKRGQKSFRLPNKSLYTFANIVHQSPPMEALLRLAMRVAKHDATVLITGESGTGKELVAQALHTASARKNGPFVAINCATLSEMLLESELFGYEDGAFTGARKGGKRGLFEAANKGTIFLDEVGEAPLATQVKLLRVLQEREVLRVGGSTPVPVDVRVIAATNRNLLEEIARERFRRDLYYRLSVISLHIPPLRERIEDVPLLLRHFMASAWPEFQTESLDEVMELLQSHPWPGNVRELRNLAEYLCILGDSSNQFDEEIGRLFRSYVQAHQAFQSDNLQGSQHMGRHGSKFDAPVEPLRVPALPRQRSAAEDVVFRKASMRGELGHILSVFREAEELGELLGCGGIQRRLARKGIFLSPQQIKLRLKKLKSMGLTVARTGSGTRLSEQGRKALADFDIPDVAAGGRHNVA